MAMKRVTRRIGLAVVMACAFGAAPLRAESVFPLYVDPNSHVGDPTSVTKSNNDLVATYPVQNVGTAVDHIFFIVPLLNVNSSIGDLAWSQSLGGWYSADVDGTSLLATVTFPNSPAPIPLLYSMVADETGLVQDTETLDPPFAQTTNPSDSYPSVDMGVFQPGETKSITVDFHFAWGDSRTGFPSGGIVLMYGTLAPNPASVPEPSSLVMGSLSALIGLGICWRRRKRVALG